MAANVVGNHGLADFVSGYNMAGYHDITIFVIDFVANEISPP